MQERQQGCDTMFLIEQLRLLHQVGRLEELGHRAPPRAHRSVDGIEVALGGGEGFVGATEMVRRQYDHRADRLALHQSECQRDQIRCHKMMRDDQAGDVARGWNLQLRGRRDPGIEGLRIGIE
jgi:hypothetical protein